MGLRFSKHTGITFERKSADVGNQMGAVDRPASSITYTEALQSSITAGVEFENQSISTFDGQVRTFAALYRKQSALRAVIDFMAKNVAQIGLKIFEKQGSASIPQPDHEMQKVIRHPSDGVPYSRFMRQLVGDVMLYDMAFVWKIRFSTRMQLLRIPIPQVSIISGSFFAPEIFGIGTGYTQERIPAADAMWLHGYSPVSNSQGISPAESLRQILAEEYAAGRDREREWNNGARIKGVLQRPGDDTSVQNKDAVDRWAVDWANKTTGDESAHGTPLLPPGVTMNWGSFDAKSMEYLGTRKLAREEVAREYGIPLAAVGLMDTSNWGTDQYHQMLYQDCFGPTITWLQEEFESQLLFTDFEDQDSGFFAEFDINQKMKGSFLDQAKIGQQAVGGPWMTRNEFREKFQNLPPLEGGDEIVVPLNVVLQGGP
ncbi:MAG: phage portal protein, partial [Actinomycetota bacterium]|nr:phage portal protein [Actinomycetota bacterium]